MAASFLFTVREAPSDVSGAKVLGQFAGSSPVELDYQIPIGGPVALVDELVSPAPVPGVGLWAAGEWVVRLTVSQGGSIAYTVEVWRVDSNGNDLEILGSRPATQTGNDVANFSIAVAETDPTVNSLFSTTDRVKLKLYAQNTDPSNVHTFGVMASQSGVATSIEVPNVATNALNPFRRNKFLGFVWRRGDGARFFDKNGVDVDSGNGY